MNFEIKDDVVHFKVEGSALSFATKESRQEFDVGYDYLSQVTVSAIYYNESANAYGTTVTIGTVAP